MYRNVYYDQRQKSMRLFTWNEDGERIESVEPFKPYLYVESLGAKDAVSIYGTPLKKVVFPTQFDRRKYANDSGLKRLFFNIKPEQQFLLERYSGLQNDPKFSQYPLKIFLLDIETYSPHSFPIPIEASHTINLITVYDSLSKSYRTLGLQKDYTPKHPNQVYIKYNTEAELLQAFIAHWSQDYPDVVTGWNSEQFDIPYIINRIINVLGEDEARKLSPVGKLFYRENIRSQFGRDVGKWIIYGVSCPDYMEVYKSFSRSERESYSLNYIASVELDEAKISYNATNLAQLSDQDWELFVDYNIQDVALLVKLEEKLRFLQIMRTISHKGFCSVDATMGKIQVIQGAIAEAALQQGKIIATFVHEDMGNYGGGFVKEITPGLREHIVTFDANSLYPNTLITLNLSPETKVGKVVGLDKDKGEVEVRLVNGSVHTLSNEKFASLVEDKQLAISKAKVLYSQKTKGIIPTYVDGLYDERVAVKARMLELEKKARKLKKNSPERIAINAEVEQLDIQQYTIKILLNSIYGVFGNSHSPFYDIDHAASITNTGQAVIKESSRIADEYIKEKYGVELTSYVYSDTDSTHLSLKGLLDAIGEPLLLDSGELNPLVYEKSNEIQAALNDGITKWAETTLNSRDPRFFFKREAICPVGIYQSKKHYILHVRDRGESDPIPCDKIKYVGVEIVKSTMSQQVKDIISSVVESIVYTKDRVTTNDVYRAGYEKFKSFSPEDLAFRSSISNYDKYAKISQNFTAGKRTPPHVKGSIWYNKLLDELGVATKYDRIESGQKIRWMYVEKNNPYGIEVLSFIGNLPTEMLDIIKPDYEKMFRKIVAGAVDRFYECVAWSFIDFQNEYTCDILSLFSE